MKGFFFVIFLLSISIGALGGSLGAFEVHREFRGLGRFASGPKLSPDDSLIYAITDLSAIVIIKSNDGSLASVYKFANWTDYAFDFAVDHTLRKMWVMANTRRPEKYPYGNMKVIEFDIAADGSSIQPTGRVIVNLQRPVGEAFYSAPLGRLYYPGYYGLCYINATLMDGERCPFFMSRSISNPWVPPTSPVLSSDGLEVIMASAPDQYYGQCALILYRVNLMNETFTVTDAVLWKDPFCSSFVLRADGDSRLIASSLVRTTWAYDYGFRAFVVNRNNFTDTAIAAYRMPDNIVQDSFVNPVNGSLYMAAAGGSDKSGFYSISLPLNASLSEFAKSYVPASTAPMTFVRFSSSKKFAIMLSGGDQATVMRVPIDSSETIAYSKAMSSAAFSPYVQTVIRDGSSPMVLTSQDSVYNRLVKFDLNVCSFEVSNRIRFDATLNSPSVYDRYPSLIQSMNNTDKNVPLVAFNLGGTNGARVFEVKSGETVVTLFGMDFSARIWDNLNGYYYVQDLGAVIKRYFVANGSVAETYPKIASSRLYPDNRFIADESSRQIFLRYDTVIAYASFDNFNVSNAPTPFSSSGGAISTFELKPTLSRLFVFSGNGQIFSYDTSNLAKGSDYYGQFSPAINSIDFDLSNGKAFGYKIDESDQAGSVSSVIVIFNVTLSPFNITQMGSFDLGSNYQRVFYLGYCQASDTYSFMLPTGEIIRWSLTTLSPVSIRDPSSYLPPYVPPIVASPTNSQSQPPSSIVSSAPNSPADSPPSSLSPTETNVNSSGHLIPHLVVLCLFITFVSL